MSDLKIDKFDYPNMKLISTIANGDCFFHSILEGTNEAYKSMDLTQKTEKAHKFRTYLAEALTPEVYNKLGRGKLKDFGLEEYSLTGMKKTLDSYKSVDNQFNELISNTLNVDIYILDKNDVYITGNDLELLYKNRPSIVIYYNLAHYQLVGIKTEKELLTFFQYDHEFIVKIRERIDEIMKERIK